MHEVVLARHGETSTSASQLVGGDAGLTAAGRAQARALGARLAAVPVDVCLTSEALRARQTAELALAGRGVSFEALPALGDIEFGSFGGRPLAEYRSWIASHAPTDAPHGGESRVETLSRIAGAFRCVLARPQRSVLMVGHGIAMLAAMDEHPQPTVTGVAYGASVQLRRDELEQAVARLEAWCVDPRW